MIIGVAVALFVVWHFIPKPKPPKPSPKFRRDPKVTGEEPGWQGFIEEHCESPAETAFLRAMIKIHKLRPENGSLRAKGLKIDLQVQEGGYRVDFLANNWLVIEIDGAAYHSSEKAQTLDQQRDQYFEDLGYSVIRIPAKLVFNDPTTAVKQVGIALDIGKRQTVLPAKESGLERLSKTMTGIKQAADKFNDDVARHRAINSALRQARETVSAERTAIDAAVGSATRKLQIQAYLDAAEGRTERYEILKSKYATIHPVQERPLIDVPALVRPECNHSVDTCAAINMAYEDLCTRRDQYLAEIRKKINDDRRLGSLVKEALIKYGCPQVWDQIL